MFLDCRGNISLTAEVTGFFSWARTVVAAQTRKIESKRFISITLLFVFVPHFTQVFATKLQRAANGRDSAPSWHNGACLTEIRPRLFSMGRPGKSSVPR